MPPAAMDSTECVHRWCQICRNLRETLLLGDAESQLRFPSVVALVDSANAGCPVCRIFRQQLVNRPGSFDYTSYQAMLDNVNRPPVIVSISGWASKTPLLTLKVGSGHRPNVHLGLQGDKWGESTGYETLPVGSYRQPSFDLKKSMKQLIDEVLSPWIQISNESELTVFSKSADFSNITATPTRLVQVREGTEDVLRLYVPFGEENLLQKYLALSYCWGSGNTPACTTEQNYAERLHDMSDVELPNTIQDAILVTRSLGLDYLWVDAICIIQQNDEDWTWEAPRMGSYYWNALLTIAAASSNDSSQGFLKMREAYRFKLEEVLVCREMERNRKAYKSDDISTNMNESDGDFYLRPMVPKSEFRIGQSPLYARGWTLQERLLSRRIVHFTEDEVFMESFSGVRYRESSRSVIPAEVLQSQPWTKEPKIREISIQNLSYTSEKLFLQHWTDLVSTYSKMKFSFEKDRLVAIQGVVDRVPLTDGKYSAGVFSSISIKQLLWEKIPDASQSNTHKTPIYPTWSWASMSGTEIHFEFEILHESTEMGTLESLEYFDVFDRKEEMQERCRIRLSGVLRGVKLSRQTGMPYVDTIPEHAGDFPVREVKRSSGAPHLPSKHLLHLFCDKTVVNPSSYNHVFCLGLAQKESRIPSRTRDVYGLLLEPTGQKGEYRRIGAFHDWCNNWCWSVWKKSPKTSVTIV